MKLKSLFESSFSKHAEKYAVKTLRDPYLSYGQLQQLTEKYAHYLTQNFERRSRIGLVLPKSPEAIAILIAIIQSDMIYVPIDSQSSANRIAYIYQDCGLTAIVGKQGLLVDIADVVQSEMDSEFAEIWQDIFALVLPKEGSRSVNPKVVEDDLAIILYTSGSTGFPKGVLLTNDNVFSFVEWAADAFQVNSDDCFSSLAMLHFDLSVFDIMVALYRGASIVLFDHNEAKNPRLITSNIELHKITICYATPSLFRLIAEFGKMEKYDCSSLRSILFAGEVYPPGEIAKLISILPTAEYYNLYGPTETNVVTWHRVDKTRNANTSIPIGKSCNHVQCNMDEDNLSNEGERILGELLVMGRSVTSGYWNRTKNTDQIFKIDQSGQRWYRTGDWVYQDSNGNFVFAGRKDRMVKKYGYRIELDEIESNLIKLSTVSDAAVVSTQNSNNTQIIGYIVSSSIDAENSTVEIKKGLTNYLPSYMIPDSIVFVEEIPKTSTVKTDYQKLIENAI